jgi:uncharacterized protein (TIGR03382 family)
VCLVLGACQSGTPTLGTTEQLAIVTSPSTSYTFPDPQQVGTTSAPVTLYVRPAAGDNYDIVQSVTANCPDFEVDAPGLPVEVSRQVKCEDCLPLPCPPSSCTTIAYQEYAFTVAFRPAVAGTTSCVVTIKTDVETRTITLYGTGTVPAIDIDVHPSSINFGDVRRGTSSTAATVQIHNYGNSSMAVSGLSISGGFAMAGLAAPYSLGPGGSQSYLLRCSPTVLGALNGQFRVTSDDPMTPTVDVQLACNGIDSALDVTPSPAALPTTRVGEPVERAVTLANTGAATMTIENVVLTGTGLTLISAPPPNTMLAALGGSTQLRIGFAAETSGEAAATVDVTYDGGQTRTIAVSANALDTSMALTPDGDVDLGPVCIGQSIDQTFTIMANAQGPFVVESISAPAAPFSITGSPVLPAGVQGSGTNQVMFSVAAAPTDPGPASSMFTVTTDIPGATPRNINVRVEGLTAGVSASPALLDFGSVALDTTTIGENVHIANCGTEAVMLSNARIEGTHANDFAIVQQPTSLLVSPTAKVSWLVVASVQEVGVRDAVFAVDTPDGTVTMNLTVEGLPESITGGGRGPASYYACSTGSGTVAWPLGLALALVLRRRRR